MTVTIRTNNLFFRGLERLKQLQLPLRRQLMLIFGSLLMTCTVVLSLVTWHQVRTSSLEQADALGNILSYQTAEVSSSLLVTGDNLSLNVLLSQLVRIPHVVSASIYSVDNLPLAKAGISSDTDLETTYSAPINYQDVVAGHVRLQLDKQLLMAPARRAAVTVLILGIVMLIAGLIITDAYGRLQYKRLRRLDNQLQKIYGNYSLDEKYAGDELNQLIRQLEKAGPPTHYSDLSQADVEISEDERVEEENKTGAVLAIKLRNLGKLQKLISPYELQSLLVKQLPLFQHASQLYSGNLLFSTEGNAFISFHGDTESLFRAACCGLLVGDLIQQVPAVAHLQLGIGISFNDQLSLVPGDQHPAIKESNACIALHLAEQNDDGRPYLLKDAAQYLPGHKTITENIASTDNVRLMGLSPDYAELMAKQKQHLLESLKKEG